MRCDELKKSCQLKCLRLPTRNIITCGSDGDYRVWNGFEDDDPVCVRVGDEATCIAFKVLIVKLMEHG